MTRNPKPNWRPPSAFMLPKGWVGSPLDAMNAIRLNLYHDPQIFGSHNALARNGRANFTTSAKKAYSQIPPATAENTGSKASTKLAADAVRTAVTRQKPGFLLLLPTFVVTHFTLGWALVPPIYLILRQTNLSNALLAGPQGAWILSRKVPEWIPDVVIDGLAGPLPSGKENNAHQMTVEELVERMARRGLHSGWRYAQYGGQALQNMRKLAAGDQEELTKEAMRRIGGTNADKAKGDTEVEAQAKGIKDRIFGYTKHSVRNAADEISFGQIRDGLAAYILVKILLPVRLPFSLFLTPKVARFAMRSFQK